MPHAIHRVIRFEIVGPYTVAASFDDESEQVIDLLPVLRGNLFGPLRDLEVFNAVRLDAEAGTLVWPNGADFDPATLHDWPQVRDEFARRASDWEASGQPATKRMESTRR